MHISAEDAGGLRTVRVAGRLESTGLEELRRTCHSTARLRLDLTELVSVDETGTLLLGTLRDEGAELVGVPPYIALLLRARTGRGT